jgi:MFS family permease
MLAVLRQRDFGLLWIAGLVSVAGDWVLHSALPYFVYQRTGSTIATAAMIVAELVPAVLLGPLAGVFVDRWDRKRVLVVANLLQGAVVAFLLLFTSGDQLWVVYVVAVAAAAISSFSVPAEGALLPNLVGPEQLVPANALNALNNRLGRLVGLPLGAALLVGLGLSAVVVVDMVSFVIAAALVFGIRRGGVSAAIPGQVPAPVTDPAAVPAAELDPVPAAELDPDMTIDEARTAFAHLWSELVDGVVLVRRERSLALVFVVLGLMTFGGTMLDPAFPAWVRDVLGQGPAVYAWLMTAHAMAGIVGSLVVGSIGHRVTPRQLMGWGSLIAGVALLVRFNVPVLAVAFALSALSGVTSVASSVGVDTLVQQVVPDRYRGRVLGSLGASGALLSLLGAMTSGVIAGTIGIVATLDIASALVALAGAVVLVVYAPRRARSGARVADVADA